MLYLTEADLLTYLKDDQFDLITQNDDANLLRVEQAAKEEMAAYLTARYNVAKIFIDVSPWLATKNYLVGNHAFDEINQKVRISIQDHQNQPIDDDNYWKDGDERNAVIIQLLAYITIYHLYQNINPRMVPESRLVNYDSAKLWLRDCARLIINPELPKLTEKTDRVEYVAYGGNTKRELRY